MLSRGFQEQIHAILTDISHAYQICLFSATLDEKTLAIADQFMKDPVLILIKKDEVTLEGITQYYIALEKKWKYDILCDVYVALMITQCIIYCNTKAGVEELAKNMKRDDHTVSFMHGEMDDAVLFDLFLFVCDFGADFE